MHCYCTILLRHWISLLIVRHGKPSLKIRLSTQTSLPINEMDVFYWRWNNFEGILSCLRGSADEQTRFTSCASWPIIIHWICSWVVVVDVSGAGKGSRLIGLWLTLMGVFCSSYISNLLMSLSYWLILPSHWFRFQISIDSALTFKVLSV